MGYVCLRLDKGSGRKVCQVGEVIENAGLSRACEGLEKAVALMVG